MDVGERWNDLADKWESSVTDTQYAALSGQIDAVFKEVEKDESFSRSRFSAALKGLQLASAQ